MSSVYKERQNDKFTLMILLWRTHPHPRPGFLHFCGRLPVQELQLVHLGRGLDCEAQQNGHGAVALVQRDP